MKNSLSFFGNLDQIPTGYFLLSTRVWVAFIGVLKRISSNPFQRILA